MGENSNQNDEFIATINSASFGNLTEENQKELLNQINKVKEKEGGILGKFLGIKKENAAMNIAFTLCSILLIFCGIDIIHAVITGKAAYTELVKGVLPVVTLTLGYIFGKGEK